MSPGCSERAPKPDLGTSEAFKRTIANAKSIGFNERGLTGIYLWRLFERLGLTDTVKSKFKDGSGADLAAKGAEPLGSFSGWTPSRAVTQWAHVKAPA